MPSVDTCSVTISSRGIVKRRENSLRRLPGYVGHGGEIGQPAMVDPAPDLRSAHPALALRYAGARQSGTEFLAGEADYGWGNGLHTDKLT